MTVGVSSTKNLVLDYGSHGIRNGVLRAQSTKIKEHQTIVEAEFRTSFLVTRNRRTMGGWKVLSVETKLAGFDPSFVGCWSWWK